MLSISALVVVAVGALYWLPASVDYTITEQYSFETAEDDASIFLGVLLPKSGPYQEVIVSEISWDGTVSREYAHYIDVVKFEGEMAGDSERDAVVELSVKLRQGKIIWQMPVEEFHTSPQYNIESDSPLIVQQAALVTQDNTQQDTRSIYRYTSEHLCPAEGYRHYRDASAVEALLSGVGSCGESANLMVALSRATGIPSQTIVGILFPDTFPFAATQVGTHRYPAESHAWVEFYTEEGWAVADPGCRSEFLNWLVFGRVDGRHLSYGEAEQLGDEYGGVHLWALRHGRLIDADFETLKYIASSDQEGVDLTPTVTVSKGWDGRWFNLAIAWLIATVLLYRFNAKQVRRLYTPPTMKFATP